MSKQNLSEAAKSLLQLALAEDLGAGDVTAELLVPAEAAGEAFIAAREPGIFCGAPAVSELFRAMDSSVKVRFMAGEGKPFRKNQTVARIRGKVRSILSAERTVLNLLGRLCAIAAQTRTYVLAVKPYGTQILDTRKTTPLWRELEKYAVLAGGGKNHRMGLYDAVFVKENHRPYGRMKELNRFKNRFEIEVRDEKELREALALRPRVILFDNFTPARLSKAVKLARAAAPRVILEASGGISLKNVSRYAAAGVDWISVGALTHSVKSLDFSLLVREKGLRR